MNAAQICSSAILSKPSLDGAPGAKARVVLREPFRGLKPAAPPKIKYGESGDAARIRDDGFDRLGRQICSSAILSKPSLDGAPGAKARVVLREPFRGLKPAAPPKIKYGESGDAARIGMTGSIGWGAIPLIARWSCPMNGARIRAE